MEDVEAWWRAAQSETEEEPSDFSWGGRETPSDLSAVSESGCSTDSWAEVWSGDIVCGSHRIPGPDSPTTTSADMGLSTLEAAF